MFVKNSSNHHSTTFKFQFQTQSIVYTDNFLVANKYSSQLKINPFFFLIPDVYLTFV